MEFLIFLGICYFLKKFFSNGNDGTHINCVYCGERILVSGEGFWKCFSCNNNIHYKSNGKVLKEDEDIHIGLRALAELYGKISKADGVVTINEIEVVDDIVKYSLELSKEQRKIFSTEFNKHKGDSDYYAKSILMLKETYNEVPDVLIMIINSLIEISSLDDGIKPKQEEILKFAINNFSKVVDIRYEDFLDEERKRHYSEKESFIDKYYSILGCEKSSSNEQVKQAYRSLVMQYHPDKHLSKDLPPDMIDYASNKFKEIQNAYEEIKKERKIS